MALNDRDLAIKDEYLRRALSYEEFLIFDGAMGTMLQRLGLDNAEELPEILSITHPREIEAIHRSYVEAGSQVITTNTFGANRLKLKDAFPVSEIYAAAADCARCAGARYVAGDIGPTGALLEPLGTLSFDGAYEIFKEQALAAEGAGCDIIIIETFADLREAKAAVLAAVENTRLPVFVTMTFGDDMRTFLGTTPIIASSLLSRLGVSAFGINCSLGPAQLASAVEDVASTSYAPIIVQPNAGLPKIVDGQTAYDMSASEFAKEMLPLIDSGANIIGGCCGTTPEFIAQLSKSVEGRKPIRPARESNFIVTSAQEAVVLPTGAHQITVIGERINPTGNKQMARALREKEYDFIISEALDQVRAGAKILDVNAGLPDIDEAQTLSDVVEALSSTLTTPLQIDSSDPEAIERAVRSYPGRPIINSVNGKQSSLSAILPIARRYGCAVLGLTLDENGIPSDPDKRYEIAKRILDEAENIGLDKDDVAIDCLVMTVATNQSEAEGLLQAIRLVKGCLGLKTVLGVSNISFGMPHREIINAAFLAAAFGAGLDMPIINPLSPSYRQCVDALSVISGQDKGSVEYIGKYTSHGGTSVNGQGDAAGGKGGDAGSGAWASSDNRLPSAMEPLSANQASLPIPEAFNDTPELANATIEGILSGRKSPVSNAIERLIEAHDIIDIINCLLIPSLDEVGIRYDRGEYFLPQLMSSAEAAKAGFDVIRDYTATNNISLGKGDGKASSHPVVLATVEGDIHDIGKNIVAMLLDNYGYEVIDLGRDVKAEAIIEALRKHNAKLLGLSALMTTTVNAMRKTIEKVSAELPDVTIMVGGAVLTPEYAESIGADFYAKDATASARIASEHCG